VPRINFQSAEPGHFRPIPVTARPISARNILATVGASGRIALGQRHCPPPSRLIGALDGIFGRDSALCRPLTLLVNFRGVVECPVSWVTMPEIVVKTRRPQ
jgi:hypothetical protein